MSIHYMHPFPCDEPSENTYKSFLDMANQNEVTPIAKIEVETSQSVGDKENQSLLYKSSTDRCRNLKNRGDAKTKKKNLLTISDLRSLMVTFAVLFLPLEYPSPIAEALNNDNQITMPNLSRTVIRTNLYLLYTLLNVSKLKISSFKISAL